MPENGIPEVPVQAQPVVEAPRRGRFVKVLAAGAIAGAVMLGALELAESDSPNPAPELAADGSVANGECVDSDTETVFYADQAPQGSNHFGPSAVEAAFTNTDAAGFDLAERLCSGADGKADPALLTGLREYFDLSDFSNPDERDAYTQEKIADKASWDADADALLAEMASYDVKHETLTGTYHTLYMIAGVRDGRPEIRQSQEQMTDKVVLTFTRTNADGTVTTKRLKLECGYQPVELEEFPDIPEIPDEPDNPTTTTTPPTPTTEPPVEPKHDTPRPTTPGETPNTTQPAPEGPATPDNGEENPVGEPIDPEPANPEPATPPEEEVPYEPEQPPIEEQPTIPAG